MTNDRTQQAMSKGLTTFSLSMTLTLNLILTLLTNVDTLCGLIDVQQSRQICHGFDRDQQWNGVKLKCDQCVITNEGNKDNVWDNKRAIGIKNDHRSLPFQEA
jgi:hypothetical protein